MGRKRISGDAGSAENSSGGAVPSAPMGSIDLASLGFSIPGAPGPPALGASSSAPSLLASTGGAPPVVPGLLPGQPAQNVPSTLGASIPPGIAAAAGLQVPAAGAVPPGIAAAAGLRGAPAAASVPPGVAAAAGLQVPPGLAAWAGGGLGQKLPGLQLPGAAQSSLLPPGLAGLASGAALPGLGLRPPGLPGVPGFPGKLPGLGSPGLPSLNSESIAQFRFQQLAAEYDVVKQNNIDPQVQELADHFGLDQRVTGLLDEEMKKRKATFEEDLQALWIGLDGSKNPAGMVMTRLKDMRMGIFRGMSALGKKVQEYAKKYRLDGQAAIRLAEVLEQREDPDGDLERLGKHLERSNKPSSLVMMMLRDLRDGKQIKDPAFGAAVGSKMHEKELKDDRKRSRSRGERNRGIRDEARGGRHDRGGRDGGRERSRDRGDRGRDRGDRDRGGEDHGRDRDRTDRDGGSERTDRAGGYDRRDRDGGYERRDRDSGYDRRDRDRDRRDREGGHDRAGGGGGGGGGGGYDRGGRDGGYDRRDSDGGR